MCSNVFKVIQRQQPSLRKTECPQCDSSYNVAFVEESEIIEDAAEAGRRTPSGSFSSSFLLEQGEEIQKENEELKVEDQDPEVPQNPSSPVSESSTLSNQEEISSDPAQIDIDDSSSVRKHSSGSGEIQIGSFEEIQPLDEEELKVAGRENSSSSLMGFWKNSPKESLESQPTFLKKSGSFLGTQKLTRLFSMHSEEAAASKDSEKTTKRLEAHAEKLIRDLAPKGKFLAPTFGTLL